MEVWRVLLLLLLLTLRVRPGDVVEDMTEDEVEDQKEDQKEDMTEDEVEDQKEDQKEDEVEDQKEDQKEDEVEDQKEDQKEDMTEDEVEDQKEDMTEDEVEDQKEDQKEDMTEDQKEDQKEDMTEDKVEDEVEDQKEDMTEDMTEDEVEDQKEDMTEDEDNGDVPLASFLRKVFQELQERRQPVLDQVRRDQDRQDQDRNPGPLVLTKAGQVRGVTLDQAHVFYGLRYADPPVGAGRWKPPRPLSPWSGVYDASFPRPACMQVCRGPGSECRSVSEDCLYLNVFVPRVVTFAPPPRSPLPVMVWIHGGDFIAGSASKPLYDGRFISNHTDTLVVNMEYRLGALGFLVSGFGPEASAVGNYGVQDQQEALRWVQHNIQAFGGDPSRVTVFGESAGGQSVSLHLTIQSSRPLFRQAVLQSPPFSIPLKSRRDAVRLGRDFAKHTNCSVSDLDCLLALTPQDILDAQAKTGSRLLNPFRFLERFQTWGPHLDGVLVTEQLVSAFLEGRWQTEKPLLLGTTSEEGVLFVFGVFSQPVSALEAGVYLAAIFKQHALQVLHQYLPLYRDADHRAMLAQIVTDFVFLCPSRRVAAAAAAGGGAWTYVFDHVPSDRRVWSGLTFCYRHACHGAELPFLFHSAAVANLTFSPPEALLSNRMLCLWAAFAHAGDPASRGRQTAFCGAQRAPAWPRYAAAAGWPVMNLSRRAHAQATPTNHRCDFWDRLGAYE